MVILGLTPTLCTCRALSGIKWSNVCESTSESRNCYRNTWLCYYLDTPFHLPKSNVILSRPVTGGREVCLQSSYKSPLRRSKECPLVTQPIQHRIVFLTPPTLSNQLPKPARLHITRNEHSRIPGSLTQKGWGRWNSLWGFIPQPLSWAIYVHLASG